MKLHVVLDSNPSFSTVALSSTGTLSLHDNDFVDDLELACNATDSFLADLEISTDREKEMMLAKLRRAIGLAGSRGNSSMYSIRVRHQDRDTAKRITQALLTIFIEGSLGENRDYTSGAQSFLDQQIVEHEKRLIEAEKRLADFKRDNMGMLPGSSGGHYGRMQSAQAQLDQARLQLSELQNRRRELERQLAGQESAVLITTFCLGYIAS